MCTGNGALAHKTVGHSGSKRERDFSAAKNAGGEMRYETQASTIYMLRLWHTREDRHTT